MAWIQAAFAGIGGFLGWYLGGLDGFLYALVAFVVVDYITGVLRAIVEKQLSSRIGAHGIAKKVALFIVVGIGHLIDFYARRRWLAASDGGNLLLYCQRGYLPARKRNGYRLAGAWQIKGTYWPGNMERKNRNEPEKADIHKQRLLQSGQNHYAEGHYVPFNRREQPKPEMLCGSRRRITRQEPIQ